jgi:hypothetical protein
MADTRDAELADIDEQIALDREQYLAAYFEGASIDAHDYADHVDKLLEQRTRVMRAPFAVDPATLPTITTRKDATP